MLIESVQLAPTRNITVQIIRSLIVSVISLIIDFGVLILLKEVFGVHYLLAATLGFCLGVVVNYFLSVKWVFAHRKFKNKRVEFMIFTGICAIGLALNLLIIGSIVQLTNVDYKLAKAISTIVVFFWNYIARKKILY